MLKLYFKQGWQLIRQNKFYTAVYILGTGLAITMVMIMAIVYHIRTANIAPESNRDRMLIVERATAKRVNGDGQSYWSMSYQTVKECYYPLKTPRAVSAAANSSNLQYALGNFYTNIPGSKDVYASSIYTTDAAFFDIFNYSFIKGKPYTEEEFQSGMHRVVLCESLAKRLFNTTDILNKTVLVNDVEFSITGVVRDVSSTLPRAYAELWIPYTAIPAIKDFAGAGGIVGIFTTFILADSPADFPIIKEEIEVNRKRYNTSISDWEYAIDDRTILTVFQSEVKKLDDWSSFNEVIIRYGLIAFLFMLVPAVNLSGLTSSRMQERISEIGIRKAFGATKGTLINQMLAENLLLTLLGGIVGLIVSNIVVYFMRDLLLGSRWEMTPNMTLSLSMLINMRVFTYAFVVCLVLNILSSYIPVWGATRRPIVQSINDK
ncbi:ABC transporter permease [Massilibacteroides sp.]|uniref:ABC transporter permease n=1 Tax=Massilibacteroides sp. TaxID=2034766 RepID=UPI0026301BBB|nr:ABC transporter permease [Massilibacteroides sp.]MDD4516046.1 ABC transporter permease [Massilibacteroides sp.]